MNLTAQVHEFYSKLTEEVEQPPTPFPNPPRPFDRILNNIIFCFMTNFCFHIKRKPLILQACLVNIYNKSTSELLCEDFCCHQLVKPAANTKLPAASPQA